MSKTTIATETLLRERLRYQWHAGYDRDDEPENVPVWSIMREEVSESGVTTFQHRYGQDTIWIRSDVVCDLTQTI